VIFVVVVWWWFGGIKTKLEGPEFGEVKDTRGKEVVLSVSQRTPSRIPFEERVEFGN
jgi:hypothetical protein